MGATQHPSLMGTDADNIVNIDVCTLHEWRDTMRKHIVGFLVLVLIPTVLVLADDLESRANDAYSRGDYETAARLYTQAADCDRSNSGVLFDGACSASLAGLTDEAFALLNRAIDVGYANADNFERDPDLEALRGDPRWASVIERVTNAGERNARFWNSDALVGDYSETLPENLRIAGLSKLWSESKFNFANFDLVPDLDIDALFLEFLPRVRAAEKTADYYLVLMEFIASLGDGHTSAYPPRGAVEKIFARPPIRTRLVEDKVLVIRVDDESLEKNGLVPGLEIVSVDGIPAIGYGNTKIRPWQPASTPQDSDVRTFEYNYLAGAAGSTITLGFQDAEGKSSTLPVRRLSRKERKAFFRPRTAFAMHELPGNVLHIELNTFDKPAAYEEFLARFDEISKADGLILDVRNNGGGNSSWGWKILSMLTDKPFGTASWETRLYRPVYRAWGRGEAAHRVASKSVVAHGTNHYDGPVVVLTSPRTYSAAEDFLVAFDAMGRGKIVGQPTGGSTGQPLFLSLPGGGSARICAKRDRYPDGAEFIGVGVRPDIEVGPTVADLRAGRDTVLEKALEVLGE